MDRVRSTEAGATATGVGVLLVDDQAPFRAAARAVLARTGSFALLAEATSGEAAVELASELHPALVLMDINLGEMDGLEATRRITRDRPSTLVVLISTYAGDDLPPEARTCGARAYVNKDDLTPQLLEAVWERGGDPNWQRDT
jgi:DNA-binding NarL/FixJ family response regulator